MAKSRAVTRTRYVSRPRRRSRSFGRSESGLSVAVLAGLAAGVVKPVTAMTQGQLKGGMELLLAEYTGYQNWDHQWNLFSEFTMRGIWALALGYLAHSMANRFGINRAIRRAGIPLVSI